MKKAKNLSLENAYPGPKDWFFGAKSFWGLWVSDLSGFVWPQCLWGTEKNSEWVIELIISYKLTEERESVCMQRKIDGLGGDHLETISDCPENLWCCDALCFRGYLRIWHWDCLSVCDFLLSLQTLLSFDWYVVMRGSEKDSVM